MAAYADFAVVKPQVAFFEAYGAAGYAVLERTIAALRGAGVLVLADAKRGDIGSTMAAYAAAWTGDSPLASDAVTASPYLGFGSLQPLLDSAAEHGRGVFVLAATSNPEGASVQRAVTGGRPVAQSIVDQAAAANRALGSGTVGVVVGATLTEVPDVSGLGGPVLVPGVGFQGGQPDALSGLGAPFPGNCCPRCRATCCGPDRTSQRCARPRSACATPWPTWPVEPLRHRATNGVVHFLAGSLVRDDTRDTP